MTRAFARSLVAIAVRVRAVVEAQHLLAGIAGVGPLAFASAHWVLEDARSARWVCAIIGTVLDAAVVAQEWRRAHALAEAVAFTVRLSRMRGVTRGLADALNVHVRIRVHVVRGAAMRALLLVTEAIVLAVRAGARHV